MPVDFSGYWKMVSNENFEAYMKALGKIPFIFLSSVLVKCHFRTEVNLFLLYNYSSIFFSALFKKQNTSFTRIC